MAAEKKKAKKRRTKEIVEKKPRTKNRYPAFGKNIFKIRKQFELSQADVADAVGTTQVQISVYENGLSEPSLEMLVKLSQFYKTSIDVMMGLDNKENIANDNLARNAKGYVSAEPMVEVTYEQFGKKKRKG